MRGSIVILFDRLGPYHLARLLAAAESMSVCALELCGETREYQWDRIEDKELRRETLFPGRDSASLTRQECRQRVFSFLDREEPAVVVIAGWSSPGALSALAWCVRRNRPAVIMSESTAMDEARSFWREAVKRRVVRLAGAGLVGGRLHREYIQTLGMSPDRVFTGYDVVDNTHFKRGADTARRGGGALRTALGLPAVYFLAANRFIEKKNLSPLLAAYAAYRKKIGVGAWSLVLLGDGSLRASLESQRADLGLEGYVFMPGFKQYAELPAYYGLASGFIHASTTEPWGLVINEAMASGLPVLVSDRCGCAPDLVEAGNNGWTFDPYDRSAMTAAMVRLSTLDRAELAAMGRASEERIAAWGPELFGQNLLAAVNSALNAPSTGGTFLDQILLRALILRP